MFVEFLGFYIRLYFRVFFEGNEERRIRSKCPLVSQGPFFLLLKEIQCSTYLKSREESNPILFSHRHSFVRRTLDTYIYIYISAREEEEEEEEDNNKKKKNNNKE